MAHDCYAYGMVAPSTLVLLEDGYPAANGYAEISRTLFNMAGEAVAGAWTLARLGWRPRIDGRWLADGEQAAELLRFLEAGGVDCSRLERRPGFRPPEEIVVSDGPTRTVLGAYKKILFGDRCWNPPRAEDIEAAAIALVDPFLGAESELCAALCRRAGVPYVTIDCGPGGPIARDSMAIIVSEEYLLREFPDASRWPEVFERYLAECPGLVVFTHGAEPIEYALPGRLPRGKRTMPALAVEAVDSTGAGDSFRAGFAHGILSGLGLEDSLRVARAVAAMVVSSFPGVLAAPTAAELGAFMATPR